MYGLTSGSLGISVFARTMLQSISCYHNELEPLRVLSYLQEGLDYRLTQWHPYTELAAYLQSAQITDIAQECW